MPVAPSGGAGAGVGKASSSGGAGARDPLLLQEKCKDCLCSMCFGALIAPACGGFCRACYTKGLRGQKKCPTCGDMWTPHICNANLASVGRFVALAQDAAPEFFGKKRTVWMENRRASTYDWAKGGQTGGAGQTTSQKCAMVPRRARI